MNEFKRKTFYKPLIGIMFLGITILLLNECFKGNAERANKVNERININWRSPSSTDIGTIGIILGTNGIRGCGDFRIGTFKGETKIACTRDGENWVYYDIWEASEDVNRTPTDQYIRFNKPN